MKRKPVILPEQRPNAGLHSQYRAELNRLLRRVRDQVNQLVETGGENLPRLIDDLLATWATQLNYAPLEVARQVAARTLSTHDRGLSSALKKHGFTVDLRLTDYTRAAMRAAVGENVGLIRSIPNQYLADVSKYVWSAVEGGFDLKQLTDNLDHAYHIGRNRCKLIARDQSNKMHAVMVKARRQELGIKKAIWMHSSAAKEPRPSHVKAHGKTFEVDKGMYLDGKWVLPGQEINCGCGSRGIIEF